MNQRILTVAVAALLALPIAAGSAAADTGPCSGSPGDNCVRPIWCDGTGYTCDASGFAAWLAGRAGQG